MSHKVLKIILFTILYGASTTSGIYSQSLDTISMKMHRHAIGYTASITSDLDGFVWFATQYGILRFDGEQFERLKSLVPQIALPEDQNYIHIHVDQTNHLWILSQTHLSSVDLNTYTFRMYDDFPSIGEVPLSYKILERDNGSIFFPHHNKVIQFDPNADSLIHHTFNLIEGSNQFTQIVEIEDDLLYLSSLENSYYWNTRSKTLELIMQDSLVSAYRNVVAYDGAGHLWINSWYNQQAGLIKYNIVKNEIVEVFSANPNNKNYLGNTDFWGMQLLDNQLYIAANNGFWKIDTRTNQCSYIIIDEASSSENRVNQLRSLHIDREGNIWLGANVNTYHSIRNEKRFNVLRTGEDKTGLITSPTTAVANIAHNKIAIGTANGMSIYNTDEGSYYNYRFPYYNGNTYNNYITSIVKNDDHSYWVGTWSGLYLQNTSTHKTIKYYITFPNAGTNHPAAVTHMYVGAPHDLCIDGNRDLWLINNGQNIYRLNESNSGDFFTYFEDPDTVPIYFSKLLYTPQYGMIASSTSGLWKFDNDGNTFEKIQTNNSQLDTQDVKGIIDMYGGRILAITNTDIYSVYHSEEQDTIELIATLPEYDRLSNPVIGLDQNLWLPTKDGILKYDLSNKQDYFFESSLYLEGIGFDVTSNFKIATLSASGNIYFASVDGVVELDPENMHFDKRPPKVVITSIESNGLSVSQTPFHKINNIVLKANQDNLLLRFTAINDQLPNKTSYRYKLNSNPWIDLSTENSIALSGLAPGNYRLSLAATSSDGIESTTPVHFQFKLKPPYYKTLWAYAAYLCLFFTITYWIYKARLNQKLKREKLRTDISRNLHDEVGGILAGIAMKSDLALQPYSDSKMEVNQIAELSRKALNKMRDVLWSIDARRDNKADLIDKMKDYVAELCGIAGIVFEFSVNGIEQGKLDAENRQHLYLIFKEAINNVVKHAQASRLDITITNDDAFEMKIQDNGIGNQNGLGGSGQGLENMRMRAAELKGSISFQFDNGGTVKLTCPKI